VHRQYASNQQHPFAHGQQSEPGRSHQRIESGAIIGDLQHDLCGSRGQADVDNRGATVLECIANPFLGHSKEAERDVFSQMARHVSGFESNSDAASDRFVAAQRLECSHQAEQPEFRRMQLV
jgi:hypothetical protein